MLSVPGRGCKSTQVASPTCSTHRVDHPLCPVLGRHESQFVRQVRLEEDGMFWANKMEMRLQAQRAHSMEPAASEDPDLA